MKICALDLALNCGYAYNTFTEVFYCGTLALATRQETALNRKQRMDRRQDPRVMKFFKHIRELQAINAFDLFIFEDVEFSSYTYQCQLWSALRTAVWTAVDDTAIIECVPVATLKRFATGHGGATKAMMCSALVRKNSRFFKSDNPEYVWYQPPITRNRELLDDNAVDAIWLWQWAAQNLSRIKK